jgi:voltage-gated potassium channel Kch
MVMSSYAVAAFIVRMGMHRATRRMGEVGVLTASLFVAGVTYLLVPLRLAGGAARARGVPARHRPGLRAAAHHHPHLQPRAGRPFRRGAGHAPHR